MTKATSLLENPTQFLLFTGKGGVGKTSLACATAVVLADGGKRILLVSTIRPPTSMRSWKPGWVPSRRLSAESPIWPPSTSIPRWPSPPTAIASWIHTGESCPRQPSPAWRSSCRALVPLRLRRLTNSPSSWVIHSPPPASTTSSSTPRRPATRSCF